jgi:hypothetical protein
MVSFREKYRLWRKRTRPASKADVARLQESVRDEISGLKIDADALTRRVDELTRLADTTTVLLQNIQSKPELGIERESLAFSYSKLSHMVSKPKLVPHSKWQSYLSINFNKPGIRILEVGSRNVTGGGSKSFSLKPIT